MIVEHIRPFHTSKTNTILRICKDFPGSSYMSGLERRTPSPMGVAAVIVWHARV